MQCDLPNPACAMNPSPYICLHKLPQTTLSRSRVQLLGKQELIGKEGKGGKGQEKPGKK